MERVLYILVALISVALVGCGGGESSANELQAKVDSLTNVVSSQQASISAMRDSIAVLQFPADQRLAKIKRLIAMSRLQKQKKRLQPYSRTFQIHRRLLNALLL